MSITSQPRRTLEEQSLWDAIVIRMAPRCFAWDIADREQGCAHLVREIADAILRERRQSIQEDHQ